MYFLKTKEFLEIFSEKSLLSKWKCLLEINCIEIYMPNIVSNGTTR